MKKFLCISLSHDLGQRPLTIGETMDSPSDGGIKIAEKTSQDSAFFTRIFPNDSEPESRTRIRITWNLVQRTGRPAAGRSTQPMAENSTRWQYNESRRVETGPTVRQRRIRNAMEQTVESAHSTQCHQQGVDSPHIWDKRETPLQDSRAKRAGQARWTTVRGPKSEVPGTSNPDRHTLAAA